MNKKIIGNWGESVAKTYLENKGYKILDVNWRHHHKEIDIVAYKNGVVGFEIKTRTNKANLAFTVLKAEQVSRLRLTLKAYCHLYHFSYNKSRLDLVLITIKNKDTVLIRHNIDI